MEDDRKEIDKNLIRKEKKIIFFLSSFLFSGKQRLSVSAQILNSFYKLEIYQ